MSIIAFIACILFIFWLLRLERKQNPSASLVLWIPTIWIMKIASRDMFFFVGRGEVADLGSGSPYERYLLIFLLVLGLATLYKRRFDCYAAIKNNIWVMVLIVYMFLSMSWTEIPFITFKRWTRELIAVVMIFVILSEDDPRRSVESILRRSIYVLIPLSLVLIMFFPDYGLESFGSSEAWIGVTNHKNGLGRLCYIAGFFLVWAFFNHKLGRDRLSSRYQMYADILVLGMTLYLMKGPGIGKSVSITAVITLGVGLVNLLNLLLARGLKRRLSRRLFDTVIVAGIVLGTASAFVGGLAVGGEFASSFGREETLTGRTAIWAKLVPFAMREPIIGHGLDGFFTKEMQESLGGLPHAHNGYLDIVLDYGFVGLFFVSMFLLSSCRRAFKTMDYDYAWGSFWISYLIMSVIHDTAEPSLGTFITQPMAVNLFLYVSSLRNVDFKPVKMNLALGQTKDGI